SLIPKITISFASLKPLLCGNDFPISNPSSKMLHTFQRRLACFSNTSTAIAKVRNS
ncbi:hypothetical protein D046_0347B, partial [Vibrio parahaemolyticus V-223/04]